jgi:SAM-dependent methyltransferase
MKFFMDPSIIQCGVCGGTGFTQRRILWDQLIGQWQLSPAETDYINRQQGKACDQCGANLRSIALANAIRAFLGAKTFLREAALSPRGKDLALLELNEAGSLTPVLKTFGRYVFGAYPEVDIHALPYADGDFDLVVHSDTLEHVMNPVHALTECRRVLKPDGALCFTVPMIVGRMTRSRDGLPNCYHGNPETQTDDLIVQTEFGADTWTYVLEAGFAEVSLHAVEYPAGLAFLARADSIQKPNP